MAQQLNQGDPTSSKTDDAAARRADEFRGTGPLLLLKNRSFWTYPEKIKAITWSRTINKEARGLDGFSLGKVQAVEPNFVRIVKGLLRKETYLIPRDLA
jgi:hypothetical protein